mmetsp:Transcript_62937/g.185891  ORF Transcript_62937/g.185891 Transcript_62937/m.185891 type:complete len:81 (+) Transcript_62937:386-628(+)
MKSLMKAPLQYLGAFSWTGGLLVFLRLEEMRFDRSTARVQVCCGLAARIIRQKVESLAPSSSTGQIITKVGTLSGSREVS